MFDLKTRTVKSQSSSLSYKSKNTKTKEDDNTSNKFE